jgi:hypothetical protein
MVPYFTYLPYAYFMKTRLIGYYQRISWIFVYFIPLIFLYSRIVSLENVYDYLVLILGMIIVNYVYDNGYLQNDIKTIKKESKPTLRLSQEEISRIDNRFGTILLMRLVILILLLSAYWLCTRSASGNVDPYILLYVSVLLQVLYLIYNGIRNIGNLFLIIPLSFIRFFGFMLPVIPLAGLGWFITGATLLYPLSKFMEFSQKANYAQVVPQIKAFNVDKFRVLYYLVLTIILGLGILEFSSPYLIMFFELSIYFLIYRFLGILIINNKKILGDFKSNFGRSGK